MNNSNATCADDHPHGHVDLYLNGFWLLRYHRIPQTQACVLVCVTPNVPNHCHKLSKPHDFEVAHDFRGVMDWTNSTLEDGGIECFPPSSPQFSLGTHFLNLPLTVEPGDGTRMIILPRPCSIEGLRCGKNQDFLCHATGEVKDEIQKNYKCNNDWTLVTHLRYEGRFPAPFHHEREWILHAQPLEQPQDNSYLDCALLRARNLFQSKSGTKFDLRIPKAPLVKDVPTQNEHLLALWERKAPAIASVSPINCAQFGVLD